MKKLTREQEVLVALGKSQVALLITHMTITAMGDGTATAGDVSSLDVTVVDAFNGAMDIAQTMSDSDRKALLAYADAQISEHADGDPVKMEASRARVKKGLDSFFAREAADNAEHKSKMH